MLLYGSVAGRAISPHIIRGPSSEDCTAEADVPCEVCGAACFEAVAAEWLSWTWSDTTDQSSSCAKAGAPKTMPAMNKATSASTRIVWPKALAMGEDAVSKSVLV